MNYLTLSKPVARITLLSLLTISIPTAVIATGSGTHEHLDKQTANEPELEGTHGHHQHKLEWGEPGQADEVNRTIEVIMGDIYFEPKSIRASEGETIGFVVKNIGKLIHEFNIGTNHMHQEHQQEMVKMLQMGMITATTINHEKMEHSDMKHDDTNSVLLEAGKSAELIWRFTQPKNLEFACNVPGHYEAGMVGVISIGKTVSRTLPTGDQYILEGFL